MLTPPAEKKRGKKWTFMNNRTGRGKHEVANFRAVARTLIGGCIFIYSGSARVASFEINFISKETSRAEPEYMNIHPPPIDAVATALANYLNSYSF